jgi:hypothetical protein
MREDILLNQIFPDMEDRLAFELHCQNTLAEQIRQAVADSRGNKLIIPPGMDIPKPEEN